MKEFRVLEKCRACGGTGIYVGMSEHDGIGVVCYICKGLGSREFVHEYDLAEGRVARTDIKQVLQVNPGIVCGGGLDFGGVAYGKWVALNNPTEFPAGSEMRKYSCPAWWYQSADYKRKPEWDECSILGTFSSCPSFELKHKCWERFDKEVL